MADGSGLKEKKRWLERRAAWAEKQLAQALDSNKQRVCTPNDYWERGRRGPCQKIFLSSVIALGVHVVVWVEQQGPPG